MILAIALLASCDAGKSAPDVDEAIALTDATNADLTFDLEFAPADVAERANVLLDWSALTASLHGEALAPADITGAELVWFRGLGPDALADALVAGDVTSADATVSALWSNGTRATSCSLADFIFLGHSFSPTEYIVAGDGTWLVRLETAADSDAMLAVLTPQSGVTESRAAISDASARIETTGNLDALEPLSVDAGAVPTVDWSGLTSDTRGQPFGHLEAQELTVARFDATDPSELADALLDPESHASAFYRQDVYGRTQAELADASADGADFPGFDAAGFWLITIACTTCGPRPPIFVGHALVAP